MLSWIKVGGALTICGLLLAACAGGTTSDKPLVITKQTNDYFQTYLRYVQQGRAGAFAVNETGEWSFYSYCESASCNGQYNFSMDAIKGCEKFGHGRCVVLASNGVIKRPYTVTSY
jgi:hypothetical protein